ncbi:MAG: hypothetical protein AB4080_09870 [Trichodesmium sp.]
METKKLKNSLNTLKKSTEKKQFNHHLTSVEFVSDDETLNKITPLVCTKSWNYGIPGWSVEHY